MKLSLASLALAATSALAAPTAKKGVDPSVCTFSDQQFFQEAACAGEWWAKKIEKQCGIKVRCSGEYTSTFGISDKREAAPEAAPQSLPGPGGSGGGIIAFLGCDGLWDLLLVWQKSLTRSGILADPDTYEQFLALIGLYNASCSVTSGPITPDPTRPGGPIVPDRPQQGGGIIPDKPKPGGPIKPSD